MCLLPGAGHVLSGAGAAVNQQALQLGQVGGGERLVAAQLVQGDVVFMRTQEGAHLEAKALKVSRAAAQRQSHFGRLAHHVFKVGVHHLALRFLQQFDEPAQMPAYLLQHGQGYVLPPLFARHGLDQHHVLLYVGDAAQLAQAIGQRPHLIAQARKAYVAMGASQLGAQHQQVKALGFFIVVAHAAGQARHMLRQLCQLIARHRVPCGGLAPLLHPAALWAHHKVVQAHARHHGVQMAGGVCAQGVGCKAIARHRFCRNPTVCPLRQLCIQHGQQLQPCLESTLAQGFCHSALAAFQVLAEELQVLAEVED